jgi:hypothetical protein
MLLSGESVLLPGVQLCVSAQLWQALSAARSFKPREISASRCRQKGSITDEVIELHVAVLHRTQVSPPMVELGHFRPSEPVLPPGPLPQRPKSGPLAGLPTGGVQPMWRSAIGP